MKDYSNFEIDQCYTFPDYFCPLHSFLRMSSPLLGALFVQAAAIIYIYTRKENFDWKNLVLHGPMPIILGLQYLLSLQYPNLRNESLGFLDPSLHSCSFMNRLLSFCMALMFLFLPYWFNQVTRFDCRSHDTAISWDKQRLKSWEEAIGRTPKNLWNSIKLLSLATTVSYYFCAFTLCYVYLFSGRTDIERKCNQPGVACQFDLTVPQPMFAVCTTRAIRFNGGYQIWPFLTWSNSYVKYALFLFYFATCGTFQYIPRPTIITPVLAGCVWLVPVLMYYRHDEWASMWICWIAPTLCLFYILEPQVLKWSKTLDSSMLKRTEDASKRRGDEYEMSKWWNGKLTSKQVMFRFLWHRFVMWKWHPWRDKTEEELEEKQDQDDLHRRIAAHAAATEGTQPVEEPGSSSKKSTKNSVVQRSDPNLGNAKSKDEFDEVL